MNQGNGGWIEWTGGMCPVPDSTSVEVLFGDGDFDKGQADDFCWDWMPGQDVPEDCDICSYRIVAV